MGIIELAILGVLGIGGYVKTRQFVRRKLRFVGAAHTPAAPLVAGGLTTLAAADRPVACHGAVPRSDVPNGPCWRADRKRRVRTASAAP